MESQPIIQKDRFQILAKYNLLDKIRSLAIGRKNYLFCGNDDAVRAAITYSLIGTCKAVNVDPRDWMTDVLMKLHI